MSRADGIVLAGLIAGLAVVLLLMGGPEGFTQGMDFNQASLEDWMGPFYEQAQSVLVGEARPVDGFIYPPSAAVLLAPMAWLNPGWLAWIGLGLQLISLVALVLLVVRLGEPAKDPLMLMMLGLATGVCYPLLHSVHWGQMGAPLAALCALSLVLWQREHSGPAAWVLAIAAGIKLYPGILWVPRLLSGRLNRMDWIAPLVVLVGLPIVIMGSDSAAFVEQVLQRWEQAWGSGGDWAGSVNRQGFPEVLGRALGFPEAGWIEDSLAWGLLLGALIHSRGLMHREGVLMGAGLLLACLPLLPGPCWPHHLSALPICWWLAAHRGRTSLLLVGLSVLLGSLPFFLLVGGWPQGLALGLPALSALAVGLAFGVPRGR